MTWSGARLLSSEIVALSLLAIEVAQRPAMDREHRAPETVIPRQEVPQPVGQREDPLAHRDERYSTERL